MTTKLESLQELEVGDDQNVPVWQKVAAGTTLTVQDGQRVLLRTSDRTAYPILDRSSRADGYRTDVYRQTEGDGRQFLFSVAFQSRDRVDNQPGRVVRTANGAPVIRVTRIGENVGKTKYKRRTSR